MFDGGRPGQSGDSYSGGIHGDNTVGDTSEGFTSVVSDWFGEEVMITIAAVVEVILVAAVAVAMDATLLRLSVMEVIGLTLDDFGSSHGA